MGTKVLIVDDEPEIVDYISLILEKHKIESHGVFTPEEGIATCEKETYAAIITDFKMPRMTGLEMIAKIKAGTKNRETPVIVLSGNLTDEVLERLERLGIIDVMSKPPEIDILVRIIEKARTKRIKKTGATYHPAVISAFHKAFTNVVKNHLGEQIAIEPPTEAESALHEVEHAGLVTLFGRRVSGMVAVSYQNGFTAEFAKVLLGREPSPTELEIFESTTGEMVEQVCNAALPLIAKECGIHMFATFPGVIDGKRAGIPLPTTHPRVKSGFNLNGKSCVMEFSFMDLKTVFGGKIDKDDFSLIAK